VTVYGKNVFRGVFARSKRIKFKKDISQNCLKTIRLSNFLNIYLLGILVDVSNNRLVVS